MRSGQCDGDADGGAEQRTRRNPFACAPGFPPGYFCPPPVYPHTPVRFTATVSGGGSGTPTGSVQFLDGSTPLATVGLDSGGSASVDVQLTSTPVSVTAHYGGDTAFGGADSGSVGQGVQPAGTTYTPPAAGLVLDGFGGLHPWAMGGASAPAPPQGAPYWPNWNIARGLAIGVPTNSCSAEVDAWGGVHPLTWAVNSPAVLGAPYWKSWDIARDIVLLPDCSGGYVLDGWGGLHPFGLDQNPPPTIGSGPYWAGWDIARAAVVLPDGTGGYVVDGWGGMHPFAIGTNAPPPAPTSTVYLAGQDVIRGASLVNRFGVLLVDQNGNVRGDARQGTVVPSSPQTPHWPFPIVDGIAAYGN
ncbi:MAG: Ig-like domain repeat protein [Actinobacteria bacterium]|nr:Ig-like domain repeat protein [Actinomycetota bacterium]